MLVVGVGGIGGTVAGSLIGADPDTAWIGLTTNRDVADAVCRDGYVVDGGTPRRGEVVTALPEGTDPFDFVLLATPPTQVEAAARGALPFVRDDGALVVLCNGLCEERVAAVAGDERVLGGIVAFGGAMDAPGVYRRTSAGGFVLGRLDGRTDDARLERLAALLAPMGEATVSTDLRGARWSKLAINCAISPLGTIGGDRLGVLMRARVVRRLALLLISETVTVARAEGVELPKMSGLDLNWLAANGGQVAKHGVLLAVGTKYRKLRSSMLRQIERGRTPAVDFLNGEIVERAARHGIPTPASAAACDLVHAIARGERTSSMDSVRELAARLDA